MVEKKFKQLSVAKDGTVWAVGKTDGTIFHLGGEAGAVGWTADKIGKAEILAAVDQANAWCVNKDHEIWHLTQAERLDKGGTWTKVATHSGQADAKTISVGNDGSVWYVQTDGTIFRLYGDAGHVGWVPLKAGKPAMSGKVGVLTAVDWGSAWCISTTHEIWFLSGAESLDKGGEWTNVTTHSGRADAKSIAVSPDGYAWYSSVDGAVFRRVRPGDGVGLPPWVTSWDRKQLGQADVLAVGPQDLVWCLNTKGDVWRAFDGKWQQLLESGSGQKTWTYEVQPKDGLMGIVRKEFHLKDPQDTQEIGRLVNLIVAQNKIKNRDRITPGDTLTLHY